MTTSPDAKTVTMLRQFLLERHWQTPRTFRTQFLRAADELAERESDPALRTLDVSVRQFQRWLDGARPRPDACRVLESMFGLPVDQLLGANTDSTATGPAVQTPTRDIPKRSRLAVPDVALGDHTVQVTVRSGAAVTVLCREGEVTRVAVLAGGPVQVLIDAPATHRGAPALPVAEDQPAVPGGARVYSMEAARFKASGLAG